MLSYLRENTGNWIIKIFLGIIVIVFVFLGVGSFGSKRGDSIATVDDEPITMKEYQQTYKSIVDQYRAQFGKEINEELLKALNIKQQALDALINQKIMIAEADKLNIKVSAKELQDALISFNAFQKDGVFNMDQYKAVLSRESLTPESFERLQRISMREGKLRSVLMSSINVSDIEAQNWYRFLNTKTSVEYIGFDPKKYTDIHPDDTQIKQYHAEHKDEYKSEPKVKALYLNFAPEDHKDKVNITEAQVKDYYDQHPKEFQIPETVEAGHILIKVDEKATEDAAKKAEKQAFDIYDRIIKGEGFEGLAKKYSEDSSKDNGGYLGRFEKQQMVKPFADQAFSMKAGEISKPVKTMFGWHIIKLISKENASTLTLSQVSEKIRQTLALQEMQNMAYLKAGEAFDAVIDGDDLDQVARISGKPVMETGEFSISGEGLDIKDRQEFAKIAFELTEDNVSDVKQIGDSYYLIKRVQKIDATVLNLDQAKDKIIKDLTENLRQAKAKEEARLYLEKTKQTQSLAQIAKDHGLELKTTPLFSRNGAIEGIGNSPEFIQAGFSLNENQKIFPEIIEAPTGYYLVGFKEKKIPDDSEMTETIADLKQQIARRKQSQAFQAWITELKKRYTIQYDPQLLN
ncbi:MAG: SurA N-terminal domain-containing protein [Desulfobacteraceae bacterium]|nr:SurA N-terminal domain-containing protein [Desulfobacteraceae bacterium]